MPPTTTQSTEEGGCVLHLCHQPTLCCVNFISSDAFCVVVDDEKELSFEPGDVLNFLRWHASDEEWCYCSFKGKEGLVPVSFIEVLDEMEEAAHHAAEAFVT